MLAAWARGSLASPDPGQQLCVVHRLDDDDDANDNDGSPSKTKLRLRQGFGRCQLHRHEPARRLRSTDCPALCSRMASCWSPVFGIHAFQRAPWLYRHRRRWRSPICMGRVRILERRSSSGIRASQVRDYRDGGQRQSCRSQRRALHQVRAPTKRRLRSDANVAGSILAIRRCSFTLSMQLLVWVPRLLRYAAAGSRCMSSPCNSEPDSVVAGFSGGGHPPSALRRTPIAAANSIDITDSMPSVVSHSRSMSVLRTRQRRACYRERLKHARGARCNVKRNQYPREYVWVMSME